MIFLRVLNLNKIKVGKVVISFTHYLKKNHKIKAELIEGITRINKIDYWTVRLDGEDIDIHAKAVNTEPDFIDKPDMIWSLKQFEKDNF